MTKHPQTTREAIVKKTIGFVLPALAAGALLAGCSPSAEGHGTMPGMVTGSSSVAAPAAQGDHNQADVSFAQQMIPHHQQAVEMAKLVPSRSSNQQVLALANQIQQEQDPEIQTMTGWLQTWGAAAPMTGSMPGMDHGSMPGMMTSDDMTKLGQAKGAAFDRLWLQMMIQHHQGAVEMANTELQQGVSSEAKQLAQQIIVAQQKEITTMNQLLSQV
jgi:uncharacterized protein (DUF305 family)